MFILDQAVIRPVYVEMMHLTPLYLFIELCIHPPSHHIPILHPTSVTVSYTLDFTVTSTDPAGSVITSRWTVPIVVLPNLPHEANDPTVERAIIC